MLRGIIFKAVTLMLLIVVFGAKCNRHAAATPGTIVVPSLGCETIQKAINTANPGDIIMVTAGIYDENIVVNKTVSIIGENLATTIIDGGGRGNVIAITSPNVVINGFTIQNGKQGDWPYCGISVFKCDSTVINNTVLRDNYYGLQLIQSNNSRIFNNVIINSSYAGIKISESNNNLFYENTIQNNFVGLWGSSSPSNIIYHNNFVNNKNQLKIFNSPMIWDDGAEGNYWSDYNGLDENMDGIGDLKYSLAGDCYPLMGTFKNFKFSYESQIYFLSTICNSTVLNFQFDELGEKVSFDILGPNGTSGFCRIAVPTTLVQGNYTVLVDDNAPLYIRNWTASTYGYTYFIYGHTGEAQKVTVTLELPGNVAPPSWVPTLVVMILIVTALTMIFLRRRKRKSEIK